MALPASVTTITVTGQYLDATGAAVRGSVTFTLDQSLLVAGASAFITATDYTVPLDATGSFSVALPATNDPDVAPSGFTWEVRENFDGGRTYPISLPTNLAPAVDLSTLAPALPAPITTFSYVLLSAVGAPTGVASLNSSGVVPASQIGEITAADIDSGAATAGFVLTADGSGNAAFIQPPGGGDELSPLLLAGG